ncbi:MAG: hypothetical protein RL885_07680 [Planctomycetota bacterium]
MVDRIARTLALLLGLGAIGSLGGCAVDYFADRGHDAAQMVGLRMGPAIGSQLHGRLTKIVQVGWGAYEGKRYGLIDGQLTSQEEIRYEFGVGPVYLHEAETSPRAYSGIVGWMRRDRLEQDYEELSWDVLEFNDRGFFDVGLAANLFVFGIDVELRTAEILDFVTGIFAIDLLGDDVQRYEQDELMDDLHSPSARTRANAVRALRIRTGEDYGYANFNEPDVRTDLQRAAIEAWDQHYGTKAPAPKIQTEEAVESPEAGTDDVAEPGTQEGTEPAADDPENVREDA